MSKTNYEISPISNSGSITPKSNLTVQTQGVSNELKRLQTEIGSSNLEEEAKSYLLNELNNLLEEQQTAREEMSYA